MSIKSSDNFMLLGLKGFIHQFKIANAYFFSSDVNKMKITILLKAAILILFLEKTW